jgi:hypothetical protein
VRYLLPEGSLFNRVRAVLIPGVNNLAAGHQGADSHGTVIGCEWSANKGAPTANS